jgi:hypothetical protein
MLRKGKKHLFFSKLVLNMLIYLLPHKFFCVLCGVVNIADHLSSSGRLINE